MLAIAALTLSACAAEGSETSDAGFVNSSTLAQTPVTTAPNALTSPSTTTSIPPTSTALKATTTTTRRATTTTSTTTTRPTTTSTSSSTTTTTAAPAPEPACHPSYIPCLEIVSDYDCKGGSGNGPYYTGRVQVIGPDDYDLDRDGDGIGCDK